MANILNLQTGDDTPDEMGRVVGSIPRDPNRAREIGDRISASRNNEELSPDASTNQSAFIRDARERYLEKAKKASDEGKNPSEIGAPPQENNSMAKAGRVMGSAGRALEATGVGAEFGAGLQAAGKVAEGLSGFMDGFKQTIEKIGYGSLFLMAGTTLLFDVVKDLIEIIPVAGWVMGSIIGGLGSATMLLWFKIKGIPWNKTRVIMFILGTIIDVTPIVNALLIFPLAGTLILTLMSGGVEAAVATMPGGSEVLKAAGEKGTASGVGQALKKAA